MLTWLGQPTIRLTCYEWETSVEGSLPRKKNKVEEIQLKPGFHMIVGDHS